MSISEYVELEEIRFEFFFKVYAEVTRYNSEPIELFLTLSHYR